MTKSSYLHEKKSAMGCPSDLKKFAGHFIDNKSMILASGLGLQSKFLTKLKEGLHLQHTRFSSQGDCPERRTGPCSLRVTAMRLVGVARPSPLKGLFFHLKLVLGSDELGIPHMNSK